MLSEVALLSVLNRMPVCWEDRDDPRKPGQLAVVARVLAEVANASKHPVDKAGKLTALWYHESKGCLKVHDGSHRGPGRGPWQLEDQHKRYEGPFVGLSYEATLNAARVASDVLDHSFQCGARPRDVFTGYAGRRCGTTWSTLDDRVSTYNWVTWRLTKWLRSKN